MAKQVNIQNDVAFLPQGRCISDDIINAIESEGKKIVYIPENIVSKFDDMKDNLGNYMSTL